MSIESISSTLQHIKYPHIFSTFVTINSDVPVAFKTWWGLGLVGYQYMMGIIYPSDRNKVKMAAKLSVDMSPCPQARLTVGVEKPMANCLCVNVYLYKISNVSYLLEEGS